MLTLCGRLVSIHEGAKKLEILADRQGHKARVLWLMQIPQAISPEPSGVMLSGNVTEVRKVTTWQRIFVHFGLNLVHTWLTRSNFSKFLLPHLQCTACRGLELQAELTLLQDSVLELSVEVAGYRCPSRSCLALQEPRYHSSMSHGWVVAVYGRAVSCKSTAQVFFVTDRACLRSVPPGFLFWTPLFQRAPHTGSWLAVYMGREMAALGIGQDKKKKKRLRTGREVGTVRASKAG